mgnify:FL=1
MNKFKFLILALLVSFQGVAQTFSVDADRLMTKVFEENGSGGIALVVKEGNVLYRKAFGMADMELQVKMTPNNIIRIGSISKQFTASAILKLMEEGKLTLQDQITKYIPDYPTKGHAITIEHLLTHTSGIKDFTQMKTWTSDLKKIQYSPKEKIDFFKNEPMDFAPGVNYKYNNSGYVLLGYIIEVVSKMKYAEYIDTYFFKPLKMNNSFYGSTSNIIKNRAKGYKKQNRTYKNADFLDMSNPYAAGALISNVDDLYAWNNAVLNYKVLSKASLKKAHSPYRLNNGKYTQYGYGWNVQDIENNSAISHSGGITGFLTFSLYLPEKDIFVAVFSNCTCKNPRQTAINLTKLALNN